MKTAPPATLPLLRENIPAALQAVDRWYRFKWIFRDGHWAKLPVTPGTGQAADSTDPATWRSLKAALAGLPEGQMLGFVFRLPETTEGEEQEAGIAGIDLDGCRNPETGEIAPWALPYVARFDTYWEASPTGTGLKGFMKVRLPAELPDGRIYWNQRPIEGVQGYGDHQPKVEMYVHARGFVVTGQHLEGTPADLRDCTAAYVDLQMERAEVYRKPVPRAAAAPLGMADDELVRRILSSAGGPHFRSLYEAGDAGDYGGDESRADFALFTGLCWWTDDAAQIERIARSSALEREKWDTKRGEGTYLTHSIARAMLKQRRVYEPRVAMNGRYPARPPDPTDAAAPPISGSTDAAAPPQPPRQSSFTDTELHTADLPVPDPIVEELLLPGAALAAGKPKTGKTWLALGLAVSVAGEGPALGRLKVRHGRVLYLALEDNARRLKKRLHMLRAGAKPTGRLHIELFWKPADKGGFDDLRQWLSEHPDCRLVVIDTWAKYKPGRKNTGDLFNEDYNPTQALNALGEEFDCCILIVHHRRKGKSDGDVFDTVNATSGMTAGVGATMILEKGKGEADGFLSVIGRDVEEQELALVVEPQSRAWTIAGDAEDFQPISVERQAIQSICAQSAEGLGPVEIATRLGQTTKEEQNATRNLVSKMHKAGQLTQKSRGRYVFVAKATKPGYIGDAVTRLQSYIRPDPRLQPEPDDPDEPDNVTDVTDVSTVTDVTDVTDNGRFSPQLPPVSLSSSSSSSREGESHEEVSSLATVASEVSSHRCATCLNFFPADQVRSFPAGEGLVSYRCAGCVAKQEQEGEER